MRIKARKCPFTGKIFTEDKINEYVLHLNKVRRDLHIKIRENNIKEAFHSWLHAEKLMITHPNQIPEWFLKNQRKLMDAFNAGIRCNQYYRFGDEKFYSTDQYTILEWEKSLQYNDLVSNSHSSPESGVQNFMGDKDKPKGYPGWSGYVVGVLQRAGKHNASYPSAPLLNMVGIRTGSGGGGNTRWGYDVKIFLDDWPGLRVEQDNIMEQRRLDAIEAEKQRIINEENEIVRRLTRGTRRW